MKKLQKPNFPQQIFTKTRKNACKICLYINDRKFSVIHQKSHKIQFEGIIQEFMDQNHQNCGPILTIFYQKTWKLHFYITFESNLFYYFSCFESKVLWKRLFFSETEFLCIFACFFWISKMRQKNTFRTKFRNILKYF